MNAVRGGAPGNADGLERYKEVINSLVYDALQKQVTFNVVVGYRKRQLFTWKHTHLEWSGTVSPKYGRPDAIRKVGPFVRHPDPIGSVNSVNDMVALAITSFFSRHADEFDQ